LKLGPRFMIATIASLALSASVAGCSSSKEEAPPGPIQFAPESDVDGPVVFLRGRPEGEKVVVDVVARGAANVHGVAFRLTWDPEALAFVTATPGGAWSRSVLSLAKEGTPGHLAVAWTEKGEASAGFDAKTDTTLGVLVFDVKGRKGAQLSFRSERSQIVDPKGAPVVVTWRGGNIPAR
jgi:hypothetical protein